MSLFGRLKMIQIYNEKDIDKLLKSVDSLKNEEITIYLGNYLKDKKLKNKFLRMVDILSEAGVKLSVEIDAKELQFKTRDLESFIEIEDELNKLNIPLHFNGGLSQSYSLNEVLNAQANSFSQSYKESPLVASTYSTLYSPTSKLNSVIFVSAEFTKLLTNSPVKPL